MFGDCKCYIVVYVLFSLKFCFGGWSIRLWTVDRR